MCRVYVPLVRTRVRLDGAPPRQAPPGTLRGARAGGGGGGARNVDENAVTSVPLLRTHDAHTGDHCGDHDVCAAAPEVVSAWQPLGAVRGRSISETRRSNILHLFSVVAFTFAFGYGLAATKAMPKAAPTLSTPGFVSYFEAEV
jgi:hypothetical protein